MKRYYFEEPTFLGDRMRTLRLEYGAKQSDVAQVLHVSRSTYSYYETGTIRPGPMVLGKLADFYQVPISVFFDAEYPPKQNHRGEVREIGLLTPEEKRLIGVLRANHEVNVRLLLKQLESKVSLLKEEGSLTVERSNADEHL